MARASALNLESLGIGEPKEIFYNLSYDEIFRHEIDPGLQGYERGTVTTLGAIAVDTGKFTGRSPKDKYFVVEEASKEHVWWGKPGKEAGIADNKPLSVEAWKHLKELCTQELSGKKLYVVDGFAGTNPDTRLSVRLITEIAWMAHFFRNMFIHPSDEDLKTFTPDWTILNACKTSCPDFAKYNMNSPVFCAFNIKERMTLIGGTWYGGEIKKGIFTIMNYFLPLRGIGAFHCSANVGKDGDTALFFGLSGTGKTTLSSDPKRALIGDDEHGWDNEGVFNFEGGCYAKCIGLTLEREPEVFKAIKRDALLENVVLDEKGNVKFNDKSKTENTRVSYPINHIENIVKPVSKGPHAKYVIFLTCDAFGVLPPVARLNEQQAMYHYLSGYTAKVAGTELGVTEPAATFSACFGKAFLALHPTKYAEILEQKMIQHDSKAYLINTGWIGGRYGVGTRIPLSINRLVIDQIFDGTLDKAQFKHDKVLNMDIPIALPGIDSTLFNRNGWTDAAAYDAAARKLAEMFIVNFQQFTDTKEGRRLTAAGPQLEGFDPKNNKIKIADGGG